MARPHYPAPEGSYQRQRENGLWVLVMPDEYWMSEAETRRLLRGTRLRYANAVGQDRIVKVDNAAHEPGYLRASVEREAQWWAQAPWWNRMLRRLWDNGP